MSSVAEINFVQAIVSVASWYFFVRLFERFVSPVSDVLAEKLCALHCSWFPQLAALVVWRASGPKNFQIPTELSYSPLLSVTLFSLKPLISISSTATHCQKLVISTHSSTQETTATRAVDKIRHVSSLGISEVVNTIFH